ncbi:hypothetical protein [Pyrodictium delaneyi]|uniref:Uncharacterized protein n=1 Tax=Pyrodictium delaneyi TaxID=1273541 RepID=A0A211YMQ2_9CREN|nr:hypothetical protein [Pyrodictium delaneyi]OWJ54332.1 hypothetical protein Pdsh_07560 [Pyrodictium delaneyi]
MRISTVLVLYNITRILSAAAASAAAYLAYIRIAGYLGNYLYSVTGAHPAIAAVTGSIHVIAVLATAALVMMGQAYIAYILLGLGAGIAALIGLDPWSILVLVVASTMLYTASLRYETEAYGAARRRVFCSGGCTVATIAVVIASYAVLAAAVYYGSLLVAQLYRFLLEPPEALPEQLAKVWEAAGQMLSVRLAILAVTAYVFYYAASRIAGPLVYALAASPEELARRARELLEREATKVREMNKWYHRMLRSSLALIGTIPAAIAGYVVVETVSSLAGGTLIPGAPWWADFLARLVLVSAASMLGYRVARRLIESMAFARINWRQLAIASVTALVLWMIVYPVLVLALRGVPITDAARVSIGNAVNILRGQEPLIPDSSELVSLTTRLEEMLSRGYQQAEYILRFIVTLLWG